MQGAVAGAGEVASRRSRSPLGDPLVLLLAAAMLASGAVLLYLTRNFNFLLDEWTFLLGRRGLNADALLAPHNEHLSLIPVLIYKSLLELFGMESARPFQVVATATFLTSAAVLFAWLRTRIDGWLALGATVLVLFMGAAWEDLLWAFQVGYFGSMAAGLGMLLALRRESRGGDRVACALLVVSICCSSLGIPFVAGALVAIATGPRWRSRVYVVAVPVALYALWWLGWGHEASRTTSLENLADAPLYVFDSIASAISSLLGLATPRDESGIGAYDWGRVLAVAAIGLAGWRLVRLGSVPRWLWVVAAIGFSFWLLSAFNQIPDRQPSSSRYQYVGGIFVILIAAELLRGVRPRPAALAVAAAVVLLAVLSGTSYLNQSAKSYDATSDLIGADLAALELARDIVQPGFILRNQIAGTGYVHVTADDYLRAADAHGSPADTPEELAAAPELARMAADRVSAAALGLTVLPAGKPGSGCARTALDTGPVEVELPPGGAVVEGTPGSTADLRLARFATENHPIGAGEVADDERTVIFIPSDRSPVPWRLLATGSGSIDICF